MASLTRAEADDRPAEVAIHVRASTAAEAAHQAVAAAGRSAREVVVKAVVPEAVSGFYRVVLLISPDGPPTFEGLPPELEP